jgi:hypothetical protein
MPRIGRMANVEFIEQTAGTGMEAARARLRQLLR